MRFAPVAFSPAPPPPSSGSPPDSLPWRTVQAPLRLPRPSPILLQPISHCARSAAGPPPLTPRRRSSPNPPRPFSLASLSTPRRRPGPAPLRSRLRSARQNPQLQGPPLLPTRLPHRRRFPTRPTRRRDFPHASLHAPCPDLPVAPVFASAAASQAPLQISRLSRPPRQRAIIRRYAPQDAQPQPHAAEIG